MSGWTVLTINGSCDSINERINSYVNELYPDSSDGYGERTIQCERNVSFKEKAKEISREFPIASYIIIIKANDVKDNGIGKLYEITLTDEGENNQEYDEHPVREIDTKNGAEGAKAQDVVQYYNSQYDLDCYSSWEA